MPVGLQPETRTLILTHNKKALQMEGFSISLLRDLAFNAFMATLVTYSQFLATFFTT